MGLFDFIVGKKKKEQERLRLEEEARHKYVQQRIRNIQMMANQLDKDQILVNDIKKESLVEDNRTSFYRLEDIKYRSMGKDLMLAPYDGFSMENYPDADILPAIANTDKIQRFLPNLGFKDKVSTQKRLEGYIIKTEAQLGVTYVIRYNNMPMGMVFVNTPLYNKKAINLSIWTVDFYISEMLEHKGIVYNSILRVLYEMKTAMNVKVVYALVDQENHDCINLIGKGFFEKVNCGGFKNSGGGLPPLVYKIDVSKIQFSNT